MSNQCLVCNGSDQVIEGSILVMSRFVTQEFFCLKCGICFYDNLTFDEDRRNSSITVARCNFPAPEPKQKTQIAELKATDRALYCGWLEILQSLEGTVDSQMAAKKFSKYACHFLYLVKILISRLRTLLKGRIYQVDMYFKGRVDAGS